MSVRIVLLVVLGLALLGCEGPAFTVAPPDSGAPLVDELAPMPDAGDAGDAPAVDPLLEAAAGDDAPGDRETSVELLDGPTAGPDALEHDAAGDVEHVDASHVDAEACNPSACPGCATTIYQPCCTAAGLCACHAVGLACLP